MAAGAASGEMTAEYIAGGNVQQCAEANRRFNRTDCCNSSDACRLRRGRVGPTQLYSGCGTHLGSHHRCCAQSPHAQESDFTAQVLLEETFRVHLALDEPGAAT